MDGRCKCTNNASDVCMRNALNDLLLLLIEYCSFYELRGYYEDSVS